ncbi:hypothetical protein J6590_054775 [Homalodisca vitripennis]|nr:hypothetical protein J6590_054775 [Homalodisca vitripennis]
MASSNTMAEPYSQSVERKENFRYITGSDPQLEPDLSGADKVAGLTVDHLLVLRTDKEIWGGTRTGCREAWFRSTGLWVMEPARFHWTTLLPPPS